MYDPALCWIRGVTDSPQLVVPFCNTCKSASQSLKAVVEFLETFVVELAVQLTIRVSPGPKTVPAAGLDQET